MGMNATMVVFYTKTIKTNAKTGRNAPGVECTFHANAVLESQRDEGPKRYDTPLTATITEL